MSAGAIRTVRPGAPGGIHAVFAHGLEDSWASWRPLAQHLPESWEISLIDLPWRPGSDYSWRVRPSGSWLVDAFAALDRPADVLIAHSFGAHAALEMMTTDTLELVVKPTELFLICPLYWAPHFTATWPVFDKAREVFAQHIADGVRAQLGARTGKLPQDVIGTMCARAVERVGPLGLLTVFDRLVSSRTLPLERLDARLMFLAAQGDPTLPSVAARYLATHVNGAEMHVSEEFDHFCHIKLASEMAARIASFATPRSLAVRQETRP